MPLGTEYVPDVLIGSNVHLLTAMRRHIPYLTARHGERSIGFLPILSPYGAKLVASVFFDLRRIDGPKDRFAI